MRSYLRHRLRNLLNARLMRLGLGYEEPKRLRIEHICLDSERAFARQLPDGVKLLKEIEETKSFYDAAHFSDAGRHEATLEGLRMLGVQNGSFGYLRSLHPIHLKRMRRNEIDVSVLDFFRSQFIM